MRLQQGRPASLLTARACALLCASAVVDSPARITDPVYDWSTGVWILRLPDAAQARAPTNILPESGVAGEAGGLYVGGGSPELPSGGHLELEELKGVGVGGKIWRSACMLCRWQAERAAHELRGANILELGAGTGASGLYAAALGARRVVLTDGEAELVPLLASNARRNREVFADGEETEIVTAQWRFGEAPPAECAVSSEAPFDLVIGSDITYSVNDDREALCRTLQLLLSTGATKRCLIAHEHRRADMFDVEAILRNRPAAAWDENDSCLGIFLAAASEHQLRVTPLHTQRGARTLQPPRVGEGHEAVVAMTTDLSVLEVSYAPR